MPDEFLSEETKNCLNCGISKPLKSFNPQKGAGGKIYYNQNCNTCRCILVKYRKTGKTDLTLPTPYIFCEETLRKLKICSRCKTPLPYEKFQKLHNGITSDCLVCRKEKRQNRYYSLTIEERISLSKKQRQKFPVTPELAKKYESNRSPEQKKKKLEANKKRLAENPVLAKKYRDNARLSREIKLSKMNENERQIFLKAELESRRKRKLVRRARESQSGFIIPFTKADIIKRDGLNCYLCGKLLTEKKATIEHVLPFSRGGHHKPENVKIACRPCNLSKHSKTLTEYKKYRGDYDELKKRLN